MNHLEYYKIPIDHDWDWDHEKSPRATARCIRESVAAASRRLADNDRPGAAVWCPGCTLLQAARLMLDNRRRAAAVRLQEIMEARKQELLARIPADKHRYIR
jgi:hypothetical protein